MRTPFLGTHNVSRAKNFADSQCINLFPEVCDTKDGKDIAALYGTPGLDLLATCGTGPVRGTFPQGRLLTVVSGQEVYSVTTSWAATLLGTVGASSGPVSIIGNGKQVAIFDGAGGYLVSASNVQTPITLPFVGPVSAGYQDGFGFVNQSGRNIWWQSNLFDLSTWQALNFSSADAKPDNINAIADIHREIFLLKENHTEVWINAGLPGFSFQRLDGVFLETGILAPASVALCGEALVWLSQTDQGQKSVVMAEGFTVRTVSTHAISREISGYANPAGAVAYSYHQEGHLFYVLSFAEATWALDLTTTQKMGIPMWHRRAAFNNGTFERHWGNTFASFNGKLVTGDYRNGNLYAFNLDTTTDAGTPKKWLRSWRALAKPSEQTTRFSSLRIDMETGITVPAGTNPQCTLRWSDDGGHTYPVSMIAAVGPPGATAQRVKFNRLGSTRRNSGLDRIFELSSSDDFYPALIGAELE